jgi:hypothetical protein
MLAVSFLVHDHGMLGHHHLQGSRKEQEQEAGHRNLLGREVLVVEDHSEAVRVPACKQEEAEEVGDEVVVVSAVRAATTFPLALLRAHPILLPELPVALQAEKEVPVVGPSWRVLVVAAGHPVSYPSALGVVVLQSVVEVSQ